MLKDILFNSDCLYAEKNRHTPTDCSTGTTKLVRNIVDWPRVGFTSGASLDTWLAYNCLCADNLHYSKVAFKLHPIKVR